MVRPIATRINQDHFGFYQVGEYKTYSKLEAVEVSAKFKKPVSWNFNKEVFSRFDWTVEPPGTLEYWYGVRAQQIRDKYNYLVLPYSGGADSHNMLMAFVKNNIFVDEILQFHSMEAYHNDKSANPNEEIFETSIPITQALLSTNPVYKNTLHRVIDITQWEKKVLTFKENKWDYFYNTNTFFSPWSQVLGHIREMEPAYAELSEQGKDVCFVWGFEKPEVRIDHNGKFFVEFTETGLAVARTPRHQQTNHKWQLDEAFYWTPDLPELASKQAHIIKKFMLKLSPEMVDGYHVLGKKLVYDEYGTGFPLIDNAVPRKSEIRINNIDYTLTSNGVHKIIYPHWNPNSITRPKPPSLFLGPIDEWMFKNNAPDMGQNHYLKGIPWLRNYVKRLDPSMWWEFKFSPGKEPYKGGFKAMTNRYSLDANV